MFISADHENVSQGHISERVIYQLLLDRFQPICFEYDDTATKIVAITRSIPHCMH